jgi:hypothetical protein
MAETATYRGNAYDKDTVCLPWQECMELKNPLEPQRIFESAASDLHHLYTNEFVTISEP